MDRVEENAYEILGLPPGPETTEADIKKVKSRRYVNASFKAYCLQQVFIVLIIQLMQAYRKLALIKHPDKNIGNPRAAEEFFQIQQAYDLLLDANGRAALDAYLRYVQCISFIDQSSFIWSNSYCLCN